MTKPFPSLLQVDDFELAVESPPKSGPAPGGGTKPASAAGGGAAPRASLRAMMNAASAPAAAARASRPSAPSALLPLATVTEAPMPAASPSPQLEEQQHAATLSSAPSSFTSTITATATAAPPSSPPLWVAVVADCPPATTPPLAASCGLHWEAAASPPLGHCCASASPAAADLRVTSEEEEAAVPQRSPWRLSPLHEIEEEGSPAPSSTDTAPVAAAAERLSLSSCSDLQLSCPPTEEEEEEGGADAAESCLLTPLQRLLRICGQEVRRGLRQGWRRRDGIRRGCVGHTALSLTHAFAAAADRPCGRALDVWGTQHSL